MLDYKDITPSILTWNVPDARCERACVSKSGVNDVIGAFKRCATLDFPLPEGITNYVSATDLWKSRSLRKGYQFRLPGQ
jgi:hypothetical protein